MPRPVEIDQPGNEALGNGIALDDADALLPLGEEAICHVAGEEGDAALGLQDIDGKADQLRFARSWVILIIGKS